jgi:far upstream element-binding protein
VGLVIGRSGENLRRIEEDTGTRIQFVTGPEAGGPQRQCKITGNPRARIDAKREINRIIEENGGNPAREASGARGGRANSKTHQPALREGENSVQIMVPDRTVGLIIGRGGETIRDLQERSGCHVNIVGENKSVNGLRPVNLIGTPQAASRAKELILEIVDSDTKTLTTQQEGGRRDNFDQFTGANAPAATGGKINDSIMVPSDAVGMIIGKGMYLAPICLCRRR